MHSLVKVLWQLEVEDVVVKLEVHVVIRELRLHVCSEGKHEWLKKPRGYVHSVDYVGFEVPSAMVIHHWLEEGGVVQHHLRVEANMKARELAEVP